MKISKRVRNDAATMLSAVASGCTWSWNEMIEALGASKAAFNLALDAVGQIEVEDSWPDWQTPWAEAEALLRTGWSPS